MCSAAFSQIDARKFCFSQNAFDNFFLVYSLSRFYLAKKLDDLTLGFSEDYSGISDDAGELVYYVSAGLVR